MTPMERASQALRLAEGKDYPDKVRAVLQAIREPSEGMEDAGARAGVDQVYHKCNAWDRCVDEEYRSDWLNYSRKSWQAMIDKALEE